MMERISAFFSGKSRQFIILFAGAFAIAFGIIDFITNAEVSLAIFYLGPICLVSWYINKQSGIYFSILSILIVVAGDLESTTLTARTLVYLWNACITFGFYIFVVWIVASLKERLLKEWALSRTDPLTGIANARHFMENAEHALSLSRRHGHPITFVYIDCDNFKEVNDELGHMQGDDLLREVAESIVEQSRLTDTVARLGGDEFVLLCPETGPANQKQHIARIRHSLLNRMKNKAWPVTFSIGVAVYVRPPESVDEMIRHADDLMYSVKRRGKNGVKSRVFK
ncbi:MAG: diguanylate cyclase [Spirochaetia bacterium]|nr:diguanylate cyclase [Spirochaetia bacterium]